MNDFRLKNQSGLTIIEVLISAVTFMIGFSLLIALLNSALVKVSTKETAVAGRLAEEIMIFAEANADTTSTDTTITRSGMKFRVQKRGSSEEELAWTTISVSRANQGKKLIELYSEFLIDNKQ